MRGNTSQINSVEGIDMKDNLIIMKRSKLFCDSMTVAKKFKYKHSRVVDKIEALVDDLGKLDKKMKLSEPIEVIKEESVYNGALFESYLMNQPFFTLLTGRIKTKESLEWQVKFQDEFRRKRAENQAIKHQLANNKADESYPAVKQISVETRKQETDAIKSFVKYAKCQGSKNADRYYTLISKMQNTALFNVLVKSKNVRSLLTPQQLNKIQICDDIVSRDIMSCIDDGMFYKDIYKKVKEKVNDYAQLVGVSDVPYNYKPAEQLELFG
jgi:phage regulator Rha-like protein